MSAESGVKKQTSLSNVYVVNSSVFNQKISEIISAIKIKEYQKIRPYFTLGGYNIFDSLVRYGNASVIESRELKAYSFMEGTMVRSLPMKFYFKNSGKSFVEDVVFFFDSNGLIDNMTFSLSKSTVESIKNRPWSDQDKLTIINFLENYKTAYALKRINYLNLLFSDNALIIVGNVMKVYNTETKQYESQIKRTTLAKSQYIKNLRNTFKQNEFVNIKFEESNALKTICNERDFYGIQIRQIYCSQHYGDEGYLFLLVDMNDPAKPIIHVRTWQNQKDYTLDSITGIYGLGSFRCE
jgi:hypothetical protein